MIHRSKSFLVDDTYQRHLKKGLIQGRQVKCRQNTIRRKMKYTLMPTIASYSDNHY